MKIQKKSEENDGNKPFGDKSQQVICEFCNQKTWTLLKPQTTYLSYLLCLIVLLVCGFWFSIILIPATLILTQTLYHVCPLCSRELGTNNRIFNHFFLEDKVIGFKLGQIGLILTRKILLGIFLSIMISIILVIKLQTLTHPHSIEKIQYFDDNWDQFLTKCSSDKLVLNAAFCVEKYLDKSVLNWEGYVVRIIDNRENFARFLAHAVELLILMQPSDSFPDIYLTFDSAEAQDFSAIFNNLERGKKIRFNGTVKSFGDQGQGRHFHGIGLQELDERIDIEDKGIGKGRYGAFRGKKKGIIEGQKPQ